MKTKFTFWLIFLIISLSNILNSQPTNPVVGVPVYWNGVATGNTNRGFAAIYYNPGQGVNSLNNTVTTLANAQHIGSTWGTAYDSRVNYFYSAAVLKRHVGYGPNGSGAIYKINAANTIPGASLLINLDGATGTLVGGGSVTINTGDATDHGTLGVSISDNTTDNPAFALAGKSGLGDIDLSPTNNTLWVINARDQQLIEVIITNPLAPTVGRVYPINTATTGVTATDGVLRSWAIEVGADNSVYIGAVATAENVTPAAPITAGPANFNSTTIRESPANRAKLQGYIFKLNPITGAFTQVANFPLNYTRGNPGVGVSNTIAWLPWYDAGTTTFPNVGDGWFQLYPQPLIADLDLLDDGTMLVGVADRFGLQTGSEGNSKPGGAITWNENGRPCGDVFRLPSSGPGTWGSVPTFFYGDVMSLPENAAALGGIAYKSGTTEFIGVTVDAISAASNGISVIGFNGVMQDNQDIVGYSAPLGGNQTIASKGFALGDVEIGVAGPAICTNPVFTTTETVATCTGSTPDNNGQFNLTALTNGDRIGVVAGATYTGGPNYAAATPITSLPYVIQNSIPNSSATTITVRIFNGSDGCYTDRTLTSTVVSCGPVLSSLGNKVWRDDDKDGIQDTGEPGVSGVTVTLYQNGTDGLPGTADDIVLGTTVTDAYGIYLFSNLTPSTNAATEYNVGFTPPTNYQFTIQTNTQVTGTSDVTNITTTTGGSTSADGNDANAVTGRTGGFWLAPGENETGVDAGIIFSQPSANSIGDRVWFDTDGSGTQNGTEPGVSGVTVTLYDNAGNVIATTVTDAGGNYIFTNLPDGNYRVGFTPPCGMNFTTKGSDNASGGGSDSNTDSDVNISGINLGKTDIINLDAAGTNPAGVNYTNVDAGLVLQLATKASLGDKVWLDLDNNGLQDAGEPGVAGVPVTLYAADGVTVVATTVTDAFGNYIFNNLDAGGYIVEFGTAPGYTRSTNQNTGTDDYVDNDASPVNGRTGVYNLVAGQRNLSIDAALVSSSPNTARVGDYVWFDANKDGIQDASETPVAGVTVTLYNATGTAIGTTTTDGNGYYQFTNLAAGTYSVGFSNLPAGYSFTTGTATSSASNTTNSDVNPATGKTSNFALAIGESLQGLDAGLIAGVASGLGSIGNKIWWDLDGDNIQDDGEPGVSGVTVTLLDYGPDGLLGGGDDGAPKTTVTNGLGEYMFTGLAAGNYVIEFGTGNTLPAGAVVVIPNSGTDDAIDSDGGVISGGTSVTAVYKLAAGEDNLTVDLGIRNTAKGSFGNKVWYDNGVGGGTANDGILNGTEIGVAGVMVTLVNAAGQPVDRAGNITTSPIVTTTDVNGYYAFADLTPGVAFASKFSNLPAGFTFTTQAGTGGADDNRSDANTTTGLTSTVTIVANTFNPNLDAGITSTRAALGNYVWLDEDGDGVQDPTEPAVPGVTATLFRPGFGLDGIAGNADDALPVATMITDQNGKYLFDNLEPGTYEVEFSTVPSGLSFTKQNTPGDNGDNTNSDANPVTGRTSGIILSAGEVDLTVDAGLFKPRAVIGNYVWVDTNNNGIQDGNEPPAPGILISLIDNNSNVVAVAVTDGNGKYLFPNVAPGTYSMSFVNLPSGTSFTTANAGGNDNLDSDVSGTTITGIVVLTTTNDISFDAGIIGFITLPVRLDLTAVKAGNTAVLTWKVVTESGVRNYTLEHSANGVSYNSIAAYLSDGRAEYTNVHTQPAAGLNYYRVRAEDADGKFVYSLVRLVRFDKNGAVIVFPNPAVDKINLQLSDTWQNQKVSIELSNIFGQTVLVKQYNNASQIETISIPGFASGVYNLRLRNEKGDVEVRKIQIVR